jgi:acyl transferase domain-containing protein/phosphopantetheinyl transferase
MTRIAIVGMACLYPGAPDVDAYWANILGKVDAMSDPPPEAWDPDVYWDPEFTDVDKSYVRRGGYLGSLASFAPLRYGIPPVAVGGEPDQWLSLQVASAAMADAGATDLPEEIRRRTSIILGKGTYLNGGNALAIQRTLVVGQTMELIAKLHPEHSEEYLTELREALQAQLPPLSPETVAGLIPNIVVGRIANRLDLMGPAYTVDAACASSLVALQHACDDLAAGEADLVLTGGAQVWMPLATLNLFCRLGALSRRERLAAFDASADGTLLGEGIGMVVLKRLEDAVADGDRVYAVVRGVGVSSDGRGMGVMAPRIEGEELALRRAYERAGVEPQTIGLLEAHGTGTPVGDVTEVQALTRVFGPRGGELLPRTALGSVKTMISHTIPAAGVASVIKTALALHHKVLPPMLNVTTPNPKLELEKTPFYLSTETRPWIHGGAEPRRAGVNAFGFGGINAHAVLEEFTGDAVTPVAHAVPWECEVFLLEGASAAELAERAGELAAAVAGEPDFTLAELSASLAAELDAVRAERPQRLAIVADSFADLHAKLEAAIAKLKDPSCKRIKTAKGTYYESEPLGYDGKVALVFPGEGSQYTNMLADLCLHFPEARAMFDRLDRLYADHRRGFVISDYVYPRPAFTDEERAAAEARLNELDLAVESVLTANGAVYEVLRRLVPRIDAVVGHSTGEHSAAMAAGALDLHVDADLAAFCHGLNDSYAAASHRQDVPRAELLSVGAGTEDVGPIVAEVGGDLYLAMDNCPHQVVLVGAPEPVAQARELATSRGFVCETLPYDRAVHTPLFEPIAADLRSIFALLPIRPPSVPLWSCTSAAPHTHEPSEIRDLLVEHWTSTVRFRETVEALHNDGFRVFIESGARGNLTAFVEDILRGRPSVAIAADVRRRSGTAQLCHLVAILAAHGVELSPGYLFEHRGVEPVDWREPARQAQPKPEARISLATTWPTMRATEELISRARDDAGHGSANGGGDGNGNGNGNGNGHVHDAATIIAAAEAVPATPPPVLSGAAPHSTEAELPASFPATPLGLGGDELSEVLGGHFSLMEQFILTGADVLANFIAPGSAAPSRPLPLLGTVVSIEPGEALVAERVIDLDSDVYLRDHTIGRGVSRTDPSLTALAVMPMTMSLEILAEAAAAVMEGLVVTGIHEVRAHRWLVVGEAPAMVEITAVRLESTAAGTADVHVLLGELNDAAELIPVIEGIVRLAPEYPAAPVAEPTVLGADARPCRYAPSELYEEPMFHGPMWRGVHSVDWVTANAAGATLRALPRDGMLGSGEHPEYVLDPVLLDAAGQLIGFWAADQLDRGRVVFPFRMASLEVFAPPPPAGEAFECRATIALHGDQLVRSDIDVIGADGLTRLRLQGWEDKRFDVPPAFHGLTIPSRYVNLSQEWPVAAQAAGAGRVACRRLGSDLGADTGLWKQVWACRVLSRRERELFAALPLPPRRQLEWLAARTAAKEAVSALVRDFSSIELLPAEIEIVPDEAGRPTVIGVEIGGLVPVVSLTHSGGEAAALAALVPAAAASGVTVGIDLERLTARPGGFAQAVLTDRERPLLAGLAEDVTEEWQLRCWCAKEAVGKAVGTGLVPGTPEAPRVVAIDVARESVHVEASGRRMIVPTRREETLIVATAIAEEARTA